MALPIAGLPAFKGTNVVPPNERGPLGKKPIEGAGGFNWYPFGTRQVALNAEAIAIKDSPYQSVLYVYSSGQTGVLFQSQFLVRF